MTHPQPGPELDDAVAKAWFDLVRCQCPKCCTSKRWSPSTDIDDAQQVLDRFRSHHIRKVKNGSEVVLYGEKGVEVGRATSNSLPHAICLAALAAVEKEQP